MDFHPNTFWHMLGMEAVQSDPENPITHLAWNAFNKFLIKDHVPATVIGYGPFFPQSQTNPDVVQSSIDYCMKVTNKPGQEHCILTCDQAIYEIVLGLQIKNPNLYISLILRMGGFHIASNFMGAIGHLMKSSVIEELLVEARVCGPGIANKIMAGKDYYAMLRAHSLILAALFELHWSSFQEWLIDEADADTNDLEYASLFLEHVNDFGESVSESELDTSKELLRKLSEFDDRLNRLMTQFQESCCSSPTSKFWPMYMDMAQILKRYVHSERAGLWEEHLTEAEYMLPYMVAARHHKYVSCVPHYLQAMKQLPTTVPYVYEAFKSGNFTVRQTTGRFNGVCSDMALEQTYNCDAKTQLFNGITQQPRTIDKYLKALPVMTSVSEKVKTMAHMKPATPSNNLDTAEKEMTLVREISTVVQSKMIRPFKQGIDGLVNIANGKKSGVTDLANAKQIGKAALSMAEDKEASSVRTVKLKTFVDKVKKTQSVVQKWKKVYEEESSVVRHLYFMQNLNNSENIKTFSHEWTSYPSSLFEPDTELSTGYAMRRGNKAEYIIGIKKQLGKSWTEMDQLPNSDQRTHLVIDMMAFIQQHSDLNCETFEELQVKYLEVILTKRHSNCDSISLVGDRYDVEPKKSLKFEERSKRERSNVPSRAYDIHDKLPIPQWKTFLMNSANKAALLNFLAKSWIRNYASLPEGITLFLGGLLRDAGKAVQLMSYDVLDVPDLSSRSHEEADSRVFSHLYYVVERYDFHWIVLQATDTDVIVMALYYTVRVPGLKKLWIHKRHTFLPCHEIVQHIGNDGGNNRDVFLKTSVLLSVHILTGCDTVSYIYRRGKKRAVGIALQCVDRLKALADYGTSDNISPIGDDVFDAVRMFFIKLYTAHDFNGDLNALRAHMFGTIKGDLRNLPPTESAFHFHVLPLKHGRQVQAGILVPILMDKEPKPNIIRQSKYCRCSKSRCQRGCLCVRANVKCVIACRCAADPRKCGRVHNDSDNDELE